MRRRDRVIDSSLAPRRSRAKRWSARTRTAPSSAPASKICSTTLGATTLVICGVLTPNSVEATARHAGNLGYQVFVVGDACWAVDKTDLRGRRWLAEDVHALSLAHLEGEYASVVDAATTLRAAAAAKIRQRRVTGKT